MKKSKFLALLLIPLSIGLFACSDDDDDEDEPAQTTNNNSGGGGSSGSQSIMAPQFSDAQATLIAIESVSNVMGIPISIGTAVAVFPDSSGALLDVGAVTVEGENMPKQSNNSYVYTANQTSPQGISFSQPIDWNVAGSSSFQGFTKSQNQAFPTVGDVSSAATVDKSDGYTLTVPTVSGADSIMFLVGDVSMTLGGSATSYTFSSAELSALANGQNIAQVAAYDIENSTQNSKKVYFLTETVKQLSVTIQD
ncbi:MAG: hypothetical protein RIC95_10005 [Vicingaceae bacterium]